MLNNKSNKFNNDLDGIVWITNQRVFVKNEKKDGMPPLINPCDEVNCWLTDCNSNILPLYQKMM